MNRRDQLTKRARSKGRYCFTKDDCRRGYQAALKKCMEDWGLFAWFFRRLRKHYRREDQDRH